MTQRDGLLSVKDRAWCRQRQLSSIFGVVWTWLVVAVVRAACSPTSITDCNTLLPPQSVSSDS